MSKDAQEHDVVKGPWRQLQMVAGKVLLLTLGLAPAGCSHGVWHGFYEAARVHQELAATPSERLGKPEFPADYDSYGRMRRVTPADSRR